jgi:hypothetical protein
MLKLNDDHPAAPLLASPVETEVTTHIVVLLSSPDVDIVSIARKVWELAQSSGAPIRLIGLCKDTTQEPGIRRTLVTIAAMLNYGNISVNIQVLFGSDWLEMLKIQLHHQDIVVCWDEPNTGMWTKPLSRILQSNLKVTLYILSGLPQEINPHASRAKAAVAWIGFITIIIVFLILQIKIYQLANQWTITLEIVSTAVEYWLIWIWNSLFR